jgi:NO-binding membrane sensor protein with MHYT domain
VLRNPILGLTGGLGGDIVVTAENFSNGLTSPLLAYGISCLGAFLGLLCVDRARAYQGAARAGWLMVASVSIGATGIWAMHFVAMLGFSIPGQTITFNVPVTIGSMLLAIVVVGIGLFTVGYGKTGWPRILAGGLIIGLGVSGMHYMGMDGMVMNYSVSYNIPLVIVSVLIAIVAGTAGLWAGVHVRGIGDTLKASLLMAVAVWGMHYTGMAAMHIQATTTMTMTGASAFNFVVPMIVGVSILTFGIAMAVWMARSAEEIAEDAAIQRRFEEIEARHQPMG